MFLRDGRSLTFDLSVPFLFFHISLKFGIEYAPFVIAMVLYGKVRLKTKSYSSVKTLPENVHGSVFMYT